MDDTPNLTLPYVQGAQAQKHVTINESLAAMDALVLLAVLDRDLSAPPSVRRAKGDRYIVGPSASGDWAGHDDAIAIWRDGAWAFYPPNTGWRAWLADESALAIWTGAAWQTAWAQPLENAPFVGINAAADATNRLALAGRREPVQPRWRRPSAEDQQSRRRRHREPPLPDRLFRPRRIWPDGR